MAENSRQSAHTARVFVISTIVLSVALFNLGFWYGVFKTIFFDKLFFVWVAATVGLIASFVAGHAVPMLSKMKWYGRITLTIPSVWLLTEALHYLDVFGSKSETDWFVWFPIAAIALLTLPYLLYLLTLVAIPDIEDLNNSRLRIATMGIAFLMGISGLAIGANHFVFLTCEDFKLSGAGIPKNCRVPVSMDREISNSHLQSDSAG